MSQSDYNNMMGTGAQNCVTPERPFTVYEAHAKAQEEWHEACHRFEQAGKQKAATKAILDKAVTALSKHMQRGINDPTEKCDNQSPKYVDKG